MPAPTNISFLTATDLGTISTTDTSVTQTVDDSGTTYTVYYSFTAPAGAVVVGVQAFGDVAVYEPTTTIWLGPAASPTQLIAGKAISALNVPFQCPVTVGDTYFLKIVPNAGNPTPATLHLKVKLSAQAAVPRGSIAVNDDTSGFPLALRSSTADETILAFVNSFSAGEAGDSLANGLVLVEDFDVDSGNGGAVLYDPTYTVLATVISTVTTGINRTKPIRSTTDGTAFYLAYKGFGATPASVVRVDDTGTVGSTVYTLTGETNVTGIGASPDETILYYVGAGGSSNNAVKRWDLTNNIAMTDLVAAVANQVIGGLGDNVLVLADGTVCVSYHNSSTSDRYVKRYSAAGATLNTYDFGSSTEIDRLASAIDATHFWVWLQPDGVTDVFKEIKASDGTVVTTVNGSEFEFGVYKGAAAASPPRFGHSNSCPFWITRNNSNTPTTIYPIRRQRRFLLPSSEDNKTMQIPIIEILMRTGIGLTAGASGSPVQGQDPQVMFRLSKDGGKTWSSERWVSAGALGNFLTRVRLTRATGNYRNAVLEVTVSDPVDWQFLAAMAPNGISEGTS